MSDNFRFISVENVPREKMALEKNKGCIDNEEEHKRQIKHCVIKSELLIIRNSLKT